MADVASISAAYDGDANAVVTRTRLVVAKHLAVMRIKSLLQVIAAASRTRDPNASPTWLDAAGKELVRLGFPWGAAAAAPRPRNVSSSRGEAVKLRSLNRGGRTLAEDAAEQIGHVAGAGLLQDACAVAFDRPRTQMY